MTDPRGGVTAYDFGDSADQLTITTLPPAGPATHVRHDLIEGTVTAERLDRTTQAVLGKTVEHYDLAGNLVRSDRYHDVAGSGQYYTTQFSGTAGGRSETITDAAGTTRTTAYNAFGQPAEQKTGNVTVSTSAYDLAGNLVQSTLIPGHGDGDGDRVTTFHHDWRNRLIASDDGVQVAFNTLNNLGEAVTTTIYDANLIGEVRDSNEDGTPDRPADESKIRAYTKVDHDARGRAYRTTQYWVDPINGLNLANAESMSKLLSNIYFDDEDRVRQTTAPGGLVTKYSYDAAGRETLTSVGSDSVVVESVGRQYDGNGNVVLVTATQREPGGSDRISYVKNEYDAADRLTLSSDFGTTHPNTQGPGIESLTTHYEYDDAAMHQKVTDARGIRTDTYFDAAGRPVSIIENAVASATSADRRWTIYDNYDGLDRPLQVRVKNNLPVAEGDWQTTIYEYNGPAGELSRIKYPGYTDSDPTPGSEQFFYNNLGEQRVKRDRSGVTHTYWRDQVGRVVRDDAGFTGTAIDGKVRAIHYAYDTLNHPTRFTSVDINRSPVNEVARQYNGFGQLMTEWQAHDGPVTTGSPKVQYTYDSSANRGRLASVTYPDGYAVSYSYGTASGLNDAISRINAVIASGSEVEDYEYLGLKTIARRGENHLTFDQFGRVEDSVWRLGPNPGDVLDHYEYVYDQGGNITSKLNGGNHTFDDVRTYNGLGHLKSSTMGNVKLVPDVFPDVSSTTTAQSTSWSVDTLGNRYGGKYADGYDADNLPNDGSYYPSGLAQSLRFSVSNHAGLKYDAWGRLVRLAPSTPAGGTPASASVGVVTYEYDALGRRIETTQGGATRHGFHDGELLVMESSSASNPSATTRYVRGVDGRIAFRQRDADGNGSLEESLWVLHDAEGNTTALVDDGTLEVVERFVYDVDGRPTALAADWTGHGNNTPKDARSSVYDFEFLAGGRRWQPVFFDILVNGEYVQGGGVYGADGGQWINAHTGRLLSPDPTAAMAARNAYDPHMEAYSESWGWKALGYAGVALITVGTGGWGALGYFALGTLGGAAIGGTISHANGSDFWTGADRGAMVGSFVGGFPGAMRGAERLTARVGAWAYNESLANARWLRSLGGPPPAFAMSSGGSRAITIGGESGAAVAGMRGLGGANVNWGGLTGNAVFSVIHGSLSAEGRRYAGISNTTPYRAGVVRPQQHHVFPQQIREMLRKRGIDIDKFAIEMDEAFHQAIHGGGNWRLAKQIGWTREWNRSMLNELKRQTRLLGRRLTPEEIITVGKQQMQRYGISGNFVRYGR